VLGLLTLALPACESGGNFTVLGYSSQPNYNCHIHTVYVPIFKNLTFERGLEYNLTQAVIRHIEYMTPYKVISDRERADTELLGTIVTVTKNILNRNQLNEVREAEMVITAQITWRDLRTGELLSQPRRASDPPPTFMPPPGSTPAGSPLEPAITTGPIQPVQFSMPAADNRPADAGGDTLPPPTPLPGSSTPLPPGAVPAPAPPPPPPPFVVIQSNSNFIPEIGGSPTSAFHTGVNSMAVQIVSMMEKPW
jgi:hypothetical protein